MAHRRLTLSLMLRLPRHLSEAVLAEVPSAESKLMWRIQQALVRHIVEIFLLPEPGLCYLMSCAPPQNSLTVTGCIGGH